MSLLVNNIAKKRGYDDIERGYDTDFAYSIWIVEKEFGFMITEHFLLRKFMHFLDNKKITRYNDMQKSQTNNKKETW